MLTKRFKVWSYRRVLPILMDILPRDTSLVLWRGFRRWALGPPCPFREV